MLKVVKGKDGVNGIVMHEHNDGIEVLFADAIEEQLSWIDNDEIINVNETSQEYLVTLNWYNDFNKNYNR